MKKQNQKEKEIEDLSNFVSKVHQETAENDLFEISFMVKYQLSEEISSTYDINEEDDLVGISN